MSCGRRRRGGRRRRTRLRRGFGRRVGDRRCLWRSSWRWRGSGRRPCGSGRCLRGRSSYRPCWRGLFLRQVGNGKFHRAINWDSGNALALIDPCIRREILLVFFVQRLQPFHALLCTRFFIITCTRRRPDHCEHDQTEQNEEKHNTEPCGEWRARVGNGAS